MAGITLEVAQARLDEYLAAEAAVLTGQEYTIADRTLRRADLKTIQDGIRLWDQRCKVLSAKASGRGRAVVPRPSF